MLAEWLQSTRGVVVTFPLSTCSSLFLGGCRGHYFVPYDSFESEEVPQTACEEPSQLEREFNATP